MIHSELARIKPLVVFVRFRELSFARLDVLFNDSFLRDGQHVWTVKPNNSLLDGEGVLNLYEVPCGRDLSNPSNTRLLVAFISFHNYNPTFWSCTAISDSSSLISERISLLGRNGVYS